MLLPLHLGPDEITIVVIDPPEINDGIVSIHIEDQLPEFVGIDHGGFVDFVSEYYRWFEKEESSPKYQSFNLPKTFDIDKTTTGFIETFKNQF